MSLSKKKKRREKNVEYFLPCSSLEGFVVLTSVIFLSFLPLLTSHFCIVSGVPHHKKKVYFSCNHHHFDYYLHVPFSFVENN